VKEKKKGLFEKGKYGLKADQLIIAMAIDD